MSMSERIKDHRMFEDQLHQATSSDEPVRERIVHELASHPDETLEAMIHVLNRPMKPYWEIATHVIRAIGYPRNAAAIPTLLAHIGDQNSLARQEAIHTLTDMGPQVVVPHLIQD